jgi:hypothetical protein
LFNPEFSGEAQRIAMFVTRPMKRQTLPIVSAQSPHIGCTLLPDFGKFALQAVGEKGYTALLDTNTATCCFHRDPNLENPNLQSLSNSLTKESISKTMVFSV